MNKKDWQDAFGPTPDAFRARVDETLDHLEERDMRKRTKFSTALVTVLLAGAAFAATNLDIWESLNSSVPIIPLESADELVATDLATAETDYFRVIAQEGVFDGYGAIVKIRVEPKDPEKYVVVADFSEPADLGEGYITEEIKYDEGMTEYRIIGREDGKEIIFLSTPDFVMSDGSADADSMVLDDIFNSYKEKYTDDGCIEYWISGLFGENLPDTLSVILQMHGMNADHEIIYGEISDMAFDLVKSNTERNVQLIPVSDGKVGKFELVDAKISFTEVRGYLTVEFAFASDNPEDGMDATLFLRDVDGNEIPTGSGVCMELENGNYKWQFEMQTFEELPETICIDVKTIDGPVNGQIECKVEEVK